MKYLIKLENGFLHHQTKTRIFFGEKNDCFKTKIQKDRIIKSLQKHNISYEVLEVF